jgi:copper(I)-binding protein
MVTPTRKSSRSSSRNAAKNTAINDDAIDVTTTGEEAKENEKEPVEPTSSKEPGKNDDEQKDTLMLDAADAKDESPQQQQVLTAENPKIAAAAAVVSSFLRKDSHLSSVQEEQVNKAFEDLFGYSWGTVFRFDDSSVVDSECSHLVRTQRLLLNMLGPTAAAHVWREMNHHNTLRISTGTAATAGQQHQPIQTKVSQQQQPQKPTVHRKQQQYKAVAPGVAVPAVTATATNPQSKDNNLAAAAAASKTQTAAISVARATVASVTTSTDPLAKTAAKSSKAGGVDQLLNQIAAGDGGINVTTKTAADWETFKETAGGGLKDKLAEQANSKQAYLQRQDFLQRVDHRKFDLEKRERDQERAKRGK